jgi:hypothetical protein
MAVEDGSNFQKLLQARRAGVDPTLIRTLGPEAAQQATTFGAQAVSRSGQAARGLAQRPGMAGTLGTAGVLGAGNLLQGDVLGAAASTIGGLAGGGAGSALAGMIPGPIGKIAKFGLPIAGALLGGMGAEQAAQGFAGKSAEAAQRPGGGGPDVEIAGVPLTATATERKQREFQRKQALEDLQTMGPAEVAATREAMQMMNQVNLEQEKALMPLREQMMRSQLTAQQAINASNAALYQQMGRTATMGKLAVGAQAEAGATTRTLLSQNPYSGAVLQAPQISFG